jgi:Flp pilus assembly protein TadD
VTQRPRLLRWTPFILIAAGLLAYANSFHGAFVYDDVNAIVDNPSIRIGWPPWEAMLAPLQSTVAGRPVVNLTLALNYAVSGLNPWSYHAFNLAVHIANALLLFGLVRRTLKGDRADEIAFAVALLWLVHPLLTDCVAYTVQRTELLMAFFLLLTLWCVLTDHLFGAVVACALGMGCKEVMAATPIVVLLYDRMFRARSFREAFRQRGGLYASLAATWLVLLASMAGNARNSTVGTEDITPWHYALTQCGVIVRYLRLAVWPRPLVLDYDDWPVAASVRDVWPSAVVVIALLGVTAWALFRRNALGFLGAWFFLILAPSSSFVPIVTEIAAERRMYLPLASVITLAVLGVQSIRRGAFRRAVVVSLAIFWGVLTVQRNADYTSDLTLWKDTVAKRPGNARAQVNLGAALVVHGAVDDAIGHFRKAIQIKPYYSDAHYNLGIALAVQGQKAEAVEELRRAIRLEPGFAKAHRNLGILLAEQGQLAEAAEHFERVVRLRPDDASAQDEWGITLARQGRISDALPHFRESLRLDSGDKSAAHHLATALIQLDRTNDPARETVRQPSP